MKILAFDPGGTSGWARYWNENPGTNPWTCGQIGPGEHHLELYEFLTSQYRSCHDRREPLWLIGESFQYRNNLDKAELISCEYIGVMKLFARTHYDTRIVWQTASQGKIVNASTKRRGSFVQQKHLQRLGLWVPGKIHAMDGYGHLLYYAINGGNPDMAELRMKLLQGGWRDGN